MAEKISLSRSSPQPLKQKIVDSFNFELLVVDPPVNQIHLDDRIFYAQVFHFSQTNWNCLGVWHPIFIDGFQKLCEGIKGVSKNPNTE